MFINKLQRKFLEANEENIRANKWKEVVLNYQLFINGNLNDSIYGVGGTLYEILGDFIFTIFSDKVPEYFFYQSGINKVTNLARVEYILNNAFEGCGNLTYVEIPDSVEEIYDYAFFGCKNLKEIIIPPSVGYFGFDIFNSCSPDLVIRCIQGSDAEEYAIKHNIEVDYI